MPSITPFLWFDNNVPEAVAFYKSVFPNAKVETVSDFMAVFELEGQRFNALNGGPQFPFTNAVSLMIDCEDQEEIDYYWDAFLKSGGAPQECSWINDKYGLSWQVAPSEMGKWISGSKEKANAVLDIIHKMKKLDIATIKEAYENA